MTYPEFRRIQSRRSFLEQSAGGIGMVALWSLMAGEGTAGGAPVNLNPMRPKPPHFRPRAKSVIWLFMSGGPSQLDLFENKPALRKWHGQTVPESMQNSLNDNFKKIATVMATPRTFTTHGRSGQAFSDLLPNLATCADDLCMVRSLTTDIPNHHPAQMIMNCGANQPGRPSMGSWVTYGLGSEAQDLPAFVVLASSSGRGIEGGTANWSNGFLPSNYRGTTFRGSGDPVLHVSSPNGVSPRIQRMRLDAIRDLNDAYYRDNGDAEIAARIASYELAFRMQTAVPELADLGKENPATLEMYGVNQETTRAFGTNCLLAQRMVERNVRFIQLYHSSWDDHWDLNVNHQKNCAMTEKPIAALLKDLKQRGLLNDTLVVWGGEFGRTPMTEVRLSKFETGREGRDHHTLAFNMWLAGGGVKAGHSVGATDELGFFPTEDKMHVHDLQATVLHCLGVDHTRLTYRHQGRDFRLTDVAGRVIEKVLA